MNKASKSQRAMARDRYHQQQREQAAWLASLAPEHLAAHESPAVPGFCSFCIAESLNRAPAAINAILSRFAAGTAPPRRADQ